jgi:hypothetical protein
MEQLLETIWDDFLQEIVKNIDGIYLCTFMLLSYLVKKHFGGLLQKITKFEWKPVYAVLIIAFITGIAFKICSDITWVKLVFTYTLGTSLHEIIFEFVEKKIKK